jgi:hypothetical protein
MNGFLLSRRFRLLLIVGAIGLLLARPSAAFAGSTIVVTGKADNATVASLAGNGKCDLREAVQAANTNATVGECVHNGTTGADVITFNISGTPPHKIDLKTTLTLTSQTTLDATSEPDYVGVPVVRLNWQCSGSCPGLVLTSTAGSGLIKGLMFTDSVSAFADSALIYLDGADGVTFQGNYVGTDGTADLTLRGRGLELDHDADSNLIGSSGAGQGNLISGFEGGSGLLILNSDSNVVQGNYIGTDVTGNVAIGNREGVGIYEEDLSDPAGQSDSNLIGGGGAGQGNLISGNNTFGIINYGLGTIIQGNWMGVKSNGHSKLASETVYTITLAGSSTTSLRDNIIANTTGGPGDTPYGINIISAATLFGTNTNNCFFGNTTAVGSFAGGTVNLENNWWGDATGPGAPGGAGSGDPITTLVDAVPFLVAEPATCPTPPVVNLLVNGSMETDSVTPTLLPDNWKGSNLILNVSTDGRVCDTAADLTCSMRIVGNGSGKKIKQQVSVSGSAGDSLSITFWSTGSNVPSSGKYRAQVKITYIDGSKGTFKLDLPTGSTGWTEYSLPFSAAKAYNRIEVSFQYSKSSGTVWFDGAVLALD